MLSSWPKQQWECYPKMNHSCSPRDAWVGRAPRCRMLSQIHFDSWLPQSVAFSPIRSSFGYDSYSVHVVSHGKCILTSHPSDMFSHHEETLDTQALSGASESFLVEIKCERIKSVKGYDYLKVTIQKMLCHTLRVRLNIREKKSNLKRRYGSPLHTSGVQIDKKYRATYQNIYLYIFIGV